MRYNQAGAVAFLIAILCLALPSRPFLVYTPHEPGSPSSHLANVRILTLHSRALGGLTHVAIVLPNGYRTSRRRYPVLYLLPGYLGRYNGWLTMGPLVRQVRRLPLIVVTPDALTGWFTNPISGTGPRWEDYDIHELIPYIDRHYRTIATRAGRAVAGLSMGGFGAFELAARHPDLFLAAGSFSGTLNLMAMSSPPAYLGLSAFGDPHTDALYWEGHDPIDLASNLRSLLLYLASGNGQPGPLDRNRHGIDMNERYAHDAMMDMVAALRRAGVPAIVDDYGPGGHGPEYWMRDLEHFLPLLMATFAHPPAPLESWSYRTTGNRFTVWGYHVVRTGAPPDWTVLQGVSRFGLTVAGTGLLTLTTDPLYPPGAAYLVTAAGVQRVAQADARGRLRLHLALSGLNLPLQVAITSAPATAARRPA